MDARSERKVSARRSARVHLPQLIREWSDLEAAFGPVVLETLTTPDGTWGTDATADWPRVRADEYGPPWTPKRLTR